MITHEQEVWVRAGDLGLPATVRVPERARGTVLFAHGSGSSRHSPRNTMVARHLQEAGLGTLLLDLLTEREEVSDANTGRYRFDIELLAQRLTGVIDWVTARPEQYPPNLGLFGASTGAAAALAAAANRPDEVRAVVSRGGRPDLAQQVLPQVLAPTLLLVGGADEAVLELNQQAKEALGDRARLVVIPHATHLFPEPGALEQVADLARDWFDLNLNPDGPMLDEFSDRPR